MFKTVFFKILFQNYDFLFCVENFHLGPKISFSSRRGIAWIPKKNTAETDFCGIFCLFLGKSAYPYRLF